MNPWASWTARDRGPLRCGPTVWFPRLGPDIFIGLCLILIALSWAISQQILLKSDMGYETCFTLCLMIYYMPGRGGQWEVAFEWAPPVRSWAWDVCQNCITGKDVCTIAYKRLHACTSVHRRYIQFISFSHRSIAICNLSRGPYNPNCFIFIMNCMTQC